MPRAHLTGTVVIVGVGGGDPKYDVTEIGGGGDGIGNEELHLHKHTLL